MKRSKRWISLLFIAYSLVMLWLLFGQRIGGKAYDSTYSEQLRSMPFPFQTIVQFGRIILTGEPAYLIPHAWQNLIGNVVMFAPLGFCLPYFSERCRTWRSVFCIGLLIIACIELTQFFTLLGSLDFDDFMLNIIGILLGFTVWRRLKTALDNR